MFFATVSRSLFQHVHLWSFMVTYLYLLAYLMISVIFRTPYRPSFSINEHNGFHTISCFCFIMTSYNVFLTLSNKTNWDTIAPVRPWHQFRIFHIIYIFFCSYTGHLVRYHKCGKSFTPNIFLGEIEKQGRPAESYYFIKPTWESIENLKCWQCAFKIVGGFPYRIQTRQPLSWYCILKQLLISILFFVVNNFVHCCVKVFIKRQVVRWILQTMLTNSY